jgi:hypothetical protein
MENDKGIGGGEYTKEGFVDLHGHPALRSKLAREADARVAISASSFTQQQPGHGPLLTVHDHDLHGNLLGRAPLHGGEQAHHHAA